MKFNDEEKRWISLIKETDAQTLMTGADQAGTPFLRHIFRLHASIFGEACTGCPNKIPQYIDRIKNLKITTKMSTKKESQFKLKAGMLIASPGTTETYSEHNITDKIAVKLLKENPNRRTLFSVLPDNWKEQAGLSTKEKTDVEELVEAHSKAELEAEAKELGLEISGTKTEIATAILKAEA